MTVVAAFVGVTAAFAAFPAFAAPAAAPTPSPVTVAQSVKRADVQAASVNAQDFVVVVRDAESLQPVLSSLAASGHSPTMVWDRSLAGFAISIDEATAETLRSNPDVISVEVDRLAEAKATQNDPPWGLDRVDQRSGALDRRYNSVATGAGVNAYVVDSGLRVTHAEFAGRVAPGFFIDYGDGSGINDCVGHGTHVAGTLGGTTYGVAKSVTIVPVKVFSCAGAGQASDLIAALDWLIGHHQPGTPAVANLSVGFDGAIGAVDAAVQAVINDGVTVTVSAGNGNVNGVGLNTCLFSPARVPAAITVAALERDDTDALWSNFGTCNDLFAPGVDVLSAGIASDTAAVTNEGTSMSAPHVAGAAALILQGQPTLAPAQVAAAIDVAATRFDLAEHPQDPDKLLYTGGTFATVQVGVVGSGEVRSTPAGIACPPTCVATFASGTSVALSATPSPGSTFTEWSGGCSGAGSCAVTPVSPLVVAATFSGPPPPPPPPPPPLLTPVLTVLANGSGSGAIVSNPAGISCPPTCGASFPSGATVTLTATATAGSVFASWSGDCSGTAPTCVLQMITGRTASASFSTSSSVRGLVTLPAPVRLLDTRQPGGITVDGVHAAVGRLAVGGVYTLPIAGRAGVPFSAATAVLNVTAVNPAAPGYLTVYPCGALPNASNLNFVTGDIVPNTVVTPLSSGSVCLYSSAATDVIVDASGWFPTTDALTPLGAPARLLDTRAPGGQTFDGAHAAVGRLAAGSVYTLPIGGRAGIPATAATAVLNVTAASPSASGYLTVYPCGSPPNASNLNFSTGDIVANAVLAPLLAGNTCIFASAATDVIVDVSGWFPNAAALIPLAAPARLLDTRVGGTTVDGISQGPPAVQANSPRVLRIAGRAGVPADAAAVALNVTVVNPTAGGYLTVYPCGAAPPNASNLNFGSGQIRANAVLSALGAGGDACILASVTTDVIVDVTAHIPRRSVVGATRPPPGYR